MTTYAQLIKKLFEVNLHAGVKLGLNNMLELCKEFNHPEQQFSSVHIAGTNGKGSVSTKIAAALQLQGKRIGLFTSPHITSFRERIRINNEMIPEAAVLRVLTKIFNFLDVNHIKATFFEITTLLAFLYFAEQKIEYAVLETGLGGRLDSTNVITPILTAITSISLEHTEILGSSIEAIAIEKAGIIKNQCPIVIGPTVPFSIIAPIAKAKDCLLEQVNGNFLDFDQENRAIARRCLESLNVPAKEIEQGVKALPSCRIEHVSLTDRIMKLAPEAVILDVAHNPDGLKRLFTTLCNRFPGRKFRIVCGLSKDKDVKNCATLLGHFGSAFHCIAANHPRALPAESLFKAFQQAGIAPVNLHLNTTISESLTLALEAAAKSKEIVVICGSFFIMAEVRQFFGFEEPLDLLELNEQSSTR